jgi:four helix bundle protein
MTKSEHKISKEYPKRKIRKSNILKEERCRIYDLEERTAKFGEAIIEFAKKAPRNVITLPLIGQLVRAGTSVGANYSEADDAESRKDFKHKIGICRKESRESRFFLRMIVKAVPELKEDAAPLFQEAGELNSIFAAIVRKMS